MFQWKIVDYDVANKSPLNILLNFDKPKEIVKSIIDSVVTGGGNRSMRCKPLPNPKSLATFSHARGGIRTRTVVKDS